ncbi:MAG: segregation/condensation protein A [Elusimicrobiota bacterium]|jgi:segregation and condensation protein A|nr:segregation/condensation protein A [Elusimicrobiota bacterium]
MNYETHLDTFEGPLDLLLHLIKKKDLEIETIKIAEITAEYLAYLDLMAELSIEIAGEFLIMASTLMQIKARSLLPSQLQDEEIDDDLEKLKDKLSEYQKYKEAAKLLSYREIENSQIYYRPIPVVDKSDFVLNATIFDLVEGFKEALSSLTAEESMTVIIDSIPIETKIREIISILEDKNYISFTDILRMQRTKMELIVCFMAVLELIKDKQIAAKQSETFGEIRIYKLEYKQDEIDTEIAPTLGLTSESGEYNGNE